MTTELFLFRQTDRGPLFQSSVPIDVSDGSVTSLRHTNGKIEISGLTRAPGIASYEKPTERTKQYFKIKNGQLELYTKQHIDSFSKINTTVSAALEEGDDYRYGVVRNRDYPKAIAAYMRAAEMGSARGYLHIGLLALNRYYKSQTPYQSFIDKAAAMGDPVAIYIKNSLAKKEGLPFNFRNVERAMLDSAMSGDSLSMYYLGEMYSEADGVPADPIQANRWFRRAADAGQPLAMCRLGWYLVAAEAGEPEGMFSLGQQYELGNKVMKDEEQAVKWYSQAAIAGHIQAMVSLGQMNEEGRGCEIDEKEAFIWYKKASDAGDSLAMYHLAKLYDQGRGVEQNLPEAIRLYRVSAEGGMSLAMNSLGEIYENGRGLEKNLNKAFDWYLKAAQAGDYYSMLLVGQMYEAGRGVDKNLDEAIRWYKRSELASNELERLGIKI